MRDAARKWFASALLLALGVSLLALSGCASTPTQGGPEYNYNNRTDYPAVGYRPWLL